MIRTIRLSNFKCFRELELQWAQLNLLCGLNGMGKSSVIQALLLLRQSFDSRDLQEGRLLLGGNLVDLGTGIDVLFEGAEQETVEFELSSDALGPCLLRFGYSESLDLLNSLEDHFILPQKWHEVPPFGGNLVYINAERIGPRKFYMLSKSMAHRYNLGPQGEYALNFLNEYQTQPMAEGDPRCVESPNRLLREVVNYWLQDISPGVLLELKTIEEADAITAGFSFDKPGDVRTRSYRATNVGFGLSYTLPVVLALLAKPGSLCIIENPEAHLHPRAQTKLAELAVQASIAGVQVIVETHSDHFMDGVRIAVHDGLITPDKIAFHYFERHGGRTEVSSPQIDIDGRMSEWPAGFFDQYEQNLAKLLAQKP